MDRVVAAADAIADEAAGDDDAKRQAALADTCHLMLCLNEFLYVD